MRVLRKFRQLTLLLIASLVLASASSLAVAQSAKPVVVLVHGAFQDASGWAAVVAALEAKGYTALTVQHAGRGDDKTPLKDITLQTYRDAVVAVVEKQAEPVIVVGHSFGGMVISAVAEAVPSRIASLVYLAAYLPRNEDSLVTLSSQDKYSELGKEGNFILAPDYTIASVKKGIFASAFCPDCNPDQLAAVAASQVDEPLAPLNEKAALTSANFGAVRKAYILTAQDVIVSPQLQALMIANTPMDEVYAVNAGHAAYITAPDAIAAIIDQIATR
jgi:pimeloyl-ACP methyl ester carboxylesterase